MQIFHSLHDPELVALLKSDAIGVLPTDTLYGVVARAASPTAVEKLYALKHREKKPGTTIAATAEQLIELGIDSEMVHNVSQYWPASLSIVMPLGSELEYLHQGVGESPFRVVADESLQMLLRQTGPLMTSSANLPGEPPAQDVAEAQAYFGEHVDFYVDGGFIGDRQPSTIAKYDNGKLTILRQGAVQIKEK
ncbi:MAG TPA: L-threonylcarbamoyladenylate synthase [Candidatus Saccharimonadales bacterium]|nr:L-threonylcarbamoyladenylate synthase [Candidatus Saccharimonadales bacterium]